MIKINHIITTDWLNICDKLAGAFLFIPPLKENKDKTDGIIALTESQRLVRLFYPSANVFYSLKDPFNRLDPTPEITLIFTDDEEGVDFKLRYM